MTRDILHDELERLWRECSLTVLFVTHNVREAARLGDRIVLLTSRPGRVASEFPVDIERPRRIDSPPVSSLAGQVTDRLREEVARHGLDRVATPHNLSKIAPAGGSSRFSEPKSTLGEVGGHFGRDGGSSHGR